MRNHLPLYCTPTGFGVEPGFPSGAPTILRGILNLSSDQVQAQSERQPLQKVGSRLRPVEVLCICFLIILSLVDIAFSARITSWWILILVNAGVAGLILALAWAENRSESRLLSVIRDWYVLPLIFVAFKDVYFMIPAIHFGRDYDELLIRLDRWIFGIDPTVWLNRFADPFLTELFQIAYALYFVMFILVGWQLYRQDARISFQRFAFICAYGFFLSYLCYFFLPAIGPRFTLHDFSALGRDLPGLWLTPVLRAIIDFGDSIPAGAGRELAAAVTLRDAFPSGHTMMALVAIYMGYRYRISLRHFVAVGGGLLIIGSVYLRYHYVIDLFAGVLLALICLITWQAVYAFILRLSLPKSSLDA